MDVLIKQTKKFTPSIREESSRPILRAVLINEQFVIATDSFRLIRIKHSRQVEAPYLYHVKTELTGHLDVSTYPHVDRMIRDTESAQLNLPITNIEKWISIHNQALVAAKEHENNNIWADGSGFKVNPSTSRKVKDKRLAAGYKMVQARPENQISFRYEIDLPKEFETVYNCKFMLDALKTFKTLNESPSLYWFGRLSPLLLKSENIDVLISPLRVNAL